MSINPAYSVMKQIPLKGLTAHSTKMLVTSWAKRADAQCYIYWAAASPFMIFYTTD